MSPYLLPGGRWLLSAIINHDWSSTRLFCWDCTLSPSGGSLVRPAATFIWEGWVPRDTSTWLALQLYSPHTVTIACSLRNTARDISAHEIISLSWEVDREIPLIKRIARLEESSHTIGAGFFRNYQLQGDYVVFHDHRSIVIWNWRENLIGTIDDGQIKWANGEGFLVTMIPPNVFIFPHEMGEILIFTLPKLHPVGSTQSHHPVQATSIISHRLIGSIGWVEWSEILVLETWKPPSVRSGLMVVFSRQKDLFFTDDAPCEFHVISLRGITPPECSPQPQLPSFPKDDFGARRTAVVNGPAGGLLILNYHGLQNAGSKFLESSFFPIAGNGVFGESVKRRFSPNWVTRYAGTLSSLCFVSGTAILGERCCGPEPNTQVVWMVCFDS
ncbi:hypothetical protein DL93DRAFT_1324833 [Clavulina sp. PMI_390]|nr:hypothetical protein DL93DRAFT_1324833 [Clavulina sp. PMI_390]